MATWETHLNPSLGVKVWHQPVLPRGYVMDAQHGSQAGSKPLWRHAVKKAGAVCVCVCLWVCVFGVFVYVCINTYHLSSVFWGEGRRGRVILQHPAWLAMDSSWFDPSLG